METRARIETAPPPVPVIDRTLQLGPDDLLPCEGELESVIVVGMPSIVIKPPRPGRLGASLDLLERLWSVVLACWARAVPVLRSIGASVGPLLRGAGRGMPDLAARARAMLGSAARSWRSALKPTGLRLRNGSPVRLRGILARDRSILQQVQARLAASAEAPGGMLLGHVDGKVVLVMDLDPSQLDAATLEEMPHTISQPPRRLETALS
jgi:hypothetical protein